MKILIVASGFTGATLPLANRFANLGHEVKFYNLVEWQLHSIESIDFDKSLRLPLGKLVLLKKSNRLYSYLNKSVDFYLLPYWKNKKKLEKLIIGKLFPLLNKLLIKKYINSILEENADFINIIIHTERELMIADAIYQVHTPFCVTYHEVLQGLVEKKQLKSVVEKSIIFGTPIIVHSHKTATDLIKAVNNKSISNRIHIINFGPFESFLSYGEGRVPYKVPDKYLLYLGYVQPYKGLKYLYEAAQILGEKLGPFKIVVAGRGYDSVIEKMKYNNRFVLLNHFIDNAEVVGLVRHCQAIICPYIAASQSGLVQTAMAFGKTVIATRVGAFTEIIDDGTNGYLCKPADAQSLADSIIKFINHTPLMFNVPNNLEWNKITEQYIQLYNNMQK